MTRENTKYCIMHSNSNNNAGYAALKCSDVKKKRRSKSLLDFVFVL